MFTNITKSRETRQKNKERNAAGAARESLCQNTKTDKHAANAA